MSNYYAVPASVYVWAENEQDALDRAYRFATETESGSEGISVGASMDEAELIEEGEE